MTTFIIGVSGYAQAGKNTVGAVLNVRHEFAERSFAEPMREAIYKLNPAVPVAQGEYPWEPLRDLVDEYGWDKAKVDFPDIRRLLQVFGTEVGRKMFGEDFWVDQAFRGIKDLRQVVFTDTRFPNEAQRIKDNGGTVWRVTRPGVEATNGHASETSLDDWNFDYVINNNSTLEDLEVQVDNAVARIRRGL